MVNYQTECLRVVTIRYLKNFIGSSIQDSSGKAVTISREDDTYCPTYSELTGGTIIQTWRQGTTPNSDRDGIAVNSAWVGGDGSQLYTNDQLVDQRDLLMKFTRFNTLSIDRSGSAIMSECGDDETLTYTYNYDRYTKSMDSSCATGVSLTNVSSACGELTYHTAFQNLANSGSSVTNCTSYHVDKNGSVSADSRIDSIYADVTFRGTSYSSNTITITQNALTGSYSVWDKNISTGITVHPLTVTTFGCAGGNYSANATGYYDVQKHWKENNCNVEYPNLTAITESGSITLDTQSGTFPTKSCPTYEDCSASETFWFEFVSGSGVVARDSITFTQTGTNQCTVTCTITGNNTASYTGGTIQLSVAGCPSPAPSSCEISGINSIGASGGYPTFTVAGCGSPTPTPTGDYVDLGLPSGTLWAKYNVGSDCEGCRGNYYDYGKGASQHMRTYGTATYSGNENPLAASADTATQVMGSPWHTPTKTQFEELVANTTQQTVTKDDGGAERRCIKFTASNGNYIVFPCVGFFMEHALYEFNTSAMYWTSTPNYSFFAVGEFNSSFNREERTHGLPVRGVIG
jgi:hypothetical protein